MHATRVTTYTPPCEVPMTRRRAPVLSVHTYNEFVDTFHQETDRAAAVLAGGYLDSFLESALRDVLVPGTRIDALFDAQGPLGSMSNKISFACALGIVTESLARDMDFIRKVRNHFAHHIFEARFDSPPVSDWCSQIAVTGKDMTKPDLGRHPPRIKYLLAVGISTISIAQSPRVSADFYERMTGIPAHLIAAPRRDGS